MFNKEVNLIFLSDKKNAIGFLTAVGTKKKRRDMMKAILHSPLFPQGLSQI
jgi:hypothetical protein